MPIATKLGKTVTYLDELLSIKLHDPSITWSCEIAGQPKIIICPMTTKHGDSITTISMATKLGRMVTYLDYFLPIESNDHIISWFCEISSQTKNILSVLPQCLWPQNKVG